MSQSKRVNALLFFIFLMAIGLFAQAPNLQEKLPVDPNVTIGQFENGLTYYIRVNKKPENRAEVRLVVNAGSVLESENQQGFAHLGEHMAFNGTTNFQKQELINYLESIGMKFGPEINAYTSFDEVVYMLQLPTDSLTQFETGFQILEDWAHLVSYDEEEINKERGVVIEEWRLGQGASSRMRDKYFPILFKDSQYAQRLPIGKINVLQNDDNDAVRNFYKNWYRPDLFAVVAVGDFDPQQVKSLIEKHFKNIEGPVNPPKREFYDVRDHEETLYAIATDVEAPRTSVAVYYKRDVKELSIVDDYRTSLVERLYNQMLSNRLDELRRKADPPFLYASSASGRFVRTKDVYYLGAGVKEDGVTRGLEALFTESLRVKKYGFVESELERAKISMLRGYERAFSERDKTESSSYAREYVNNFLENETIPGIENEYNYAKSFLPGVSVEEVNGLISSFITDYNKVVVVQMPEKDAVEIPTEDELAKVMRAAMQQDIQPYKDSVSDAPLLAKIPTAGKLVKEEHIEDVDLFEWTLSNGVKVVLKSTNFKNDEIRFSGKSWGGSSLGNDQDWYSLRSASAIINQSGWGEFDAIALRNKLSGKIANVYAGIGETMESLSGSASPKDIETLFQLIYLSFTAPRMDDNAFQSYKARVKGYLENQGAMPESVFADSVTAVMNGYHLRRMPFAVDDLEKMDLQKMSDFYKDRYANAGDFTFFFVGNFDIEKMKPLVLTYLGGLPNINRQEKWRDVKVQKATGHIERTIRKGVEQKARVRLLFTGEYEFNRENNYALYSLRDVLNIKLREVVREDKSGTYGIRVSASANKIPKESYQLSISFGCAPDRVDELTQTVHNVLDSVKTSGIDEKYISKVQETDLRSFETDLEKNGFWLGKLEQYHRLQWDPKDILTYPDLVNSLSVEAIQKAAQIYFDGENVAKFILLPEE
jgi:zinc protease